MTNQYKEFTINHVKHWNPTDGTCYRQTINVRQETFDRLQNALNNEISKRQKQGERIGYLSAPLEHDGDTVYLNLTQRDFAVNFLNLRGKTTDDNTCLRIIDKQRTRDIMNKLITIYATQIREALATYSTDSQYTEQILRAVGSIEATAKRQALK